MLGEHGRNALSHVVLVFTAMNEHALMALLVMLVVMDLQKNKANAKKL